MTLFLLNSLLHLGILVVLNSVVSQPVPEPTRPLPSKDNQVVKDLINDLLGDSDSDEDSPPPTTPIPFPLTLINSSEYWSLDVQPAHSIRDEMGASEWLEGYLREAQVLYHVAAESRWNYLTNLTSANRAKLVNSEQALSLFLKSTAAQARQFNLQSFAGNGTLQRVLQMLSVEGLSALPDEQYSRYTELQRELSEDFANGAVCEQGRPPPCTQRYNQLQHFMSLSRDPEELTYMWLAWRNSVGPPMKEKFIELVKLSNEGAMLNGFTDAGELWRSPYEESAPMIGREPAMNLTNELDRLYQQTLPLYLELHAYMRRQLAELFPPLSIPSLTKDAHIPAHILGSMSGDNWLSLYHETKPFPEPSSGPSVEQDPWASPFAELSTDPFNKRLQSMQYTVVKMFKEAQQWYKSMGFRDLPESLWEKSLLSRKFNVDVFCHPPTAFDMKDGNDFRVKICAQVMKEDFIEAHRLLAHTHYQMEYSKQPLPFQEGANPSFPQAIAEAAALAAMSPQNLEELGLKESSPLPPPSQDQTDPHSPDSNEEQVNSLFELALEHIAAGPFSLVVDLWRWGVYSGSIPPSQYNQAWWNLRKKYQGLIPPTKRSESDFDAGSNPAVSQMHFPAVRKFITHVLQFQILRSLCRAASGSTTDPLDLQKCDLRGSNAAGHKLKSVMELGISRSWPEALEAVTGSSRLDASALMEFYAPLMNWLTRDNRKKGEYVGWDGPGTPYGGTVGSVPEGNDFGHSFLTEDQVAFPGDACAGGKQCLLSSKCNGTHCDCEEGTVFHDGTCLPNDPEFAIGFNTGLNFAAVDRVSTVTPETVKGEPEPTQAASSLSSPAQFLSLSFLILSYLLFL